MPNETAVRPEPDKQAKIGDIEEDLEYTREQLGQTVQELTDRLAAKARPLSYLAAALAAVAVAIVATVVIRRRRR
jgi:molybdopterin converting factor small subunit